MFKGPFLNLIVLYIIIVLYNKPVCIPIQLNNSIVKRFIKNKLSINRYDLDQVTFCTLSLRTTNILSLYLPALDLRHNVCVWLPDNLVCITLNVEKWIAFKDIYAGEKS